MTKSRSFAASCEPFEGSAAVYDLIYADKPHAREADLYHDLLTDGLDLPESPSLIEWGAGTGLHMPEWERLGWKATGVVPSAAMLVEASKKNIKLVHGSLHDSRLFKKLNPNDAAVAPFAVMSYAGTTNEKLTKSLQMVRCHLKIGCRFVFDVINLAAAASLLHPSGHIQVQDDKRTVRRFMTRTFNVKRSIVETLFEFVIVGRAGTTFPPEEWTETHLMRAFSPIEIALALESCGFRVLKQFDPEIDDNSEIVLSDSWYFLTVAEAV